MTNIVDGWAKNVAWIENSERLHDYFLASHRERLEFGELWINGSIDKSTIESTVMRLVSLAHSGNFERINVFINCYGGLVDEGFALIDMIMLCPIPVWTINVGEAASMGLSLFMAGDRRLTLPHASFMAHSISYSNGNADKLGEQESYMAFVKTKQQNMAAYYASRSKKTVKWWLNKYREADYYFDSEEAVTLGIATDIIDSCEVYNEIFDSVLRENNVILSDKE